MNHEGRNPQRSDRRGHRGIRTIGAAGTVLLLLALLGCAGVQTPPEPEATPPSPPGASASVAVPAGETPIEVLKGLLSDRRAKPALIGAGALLGALVLAVALGKILRGDAPKSGPETVARG
jgi:hypothetical protein